MVEKSVVKLAVDPHKRINAVVAVDMTGKVLARGTFAQSTTGFTDLMGFARRWPRREWAIEGATGVGAETLRLLSNRRDELVGLRTQAICRLHRELQILIPGGASRALTAARAKAWLSSVRPRDEVGKVLKALALDQLADLVAIDKRLKDIGIQIKPVVAQTHTSVTEVRGGLPRVWLTLGVDGSYAASAAW